MKMKVIDRIILAFYALLSATALFIVCLCFIAPVSAVDLDNIAWMRPVSWLLVLGLVAWCVRLIRLQFMPDGSAPKNTAAVQSAEEGNVRVSVRAMETLARRAIALSEEVLDSKLRIVNNEDSVCVEVDIVVGSDTHVPALTALLQRNVKGSIEEFAGVAVQKVVVLVTDIRETTPALPAPAAEPVQAVVVEAEKVEVHEEAAAEEAEEAAEAVSEEEAVEETEAASEEEAVEETEAVSEEEAVEETEAVSEEEAVEETEAASEEEAFEEAEAVSEEEAEEATETVEVFEAEVAEEWAETIGAKSSEETNGEAISRQ